MTTDNKAKAKKTVKLTDFKPMQDELLTLRAERTELLELLEECELHLQTKYPKEAAINDKVSRFIERLKH